jgi:wyosine [tRNA(Phe)-imidazoG37] synthetase (radical SAM superfamily)
MARFRARYKGELAIEILLVKGANDTDENFAALAAALKKIAPDRVDIGSIERPSAYRVQAASIETMRSLLDRLAGLNAQIIPSAYAAAKQSLDKESLLALLNRRSLSSDEAAAILDDRSIALLNDLVASGLVAIKTQSDKRFYALEVISSK